jgi:hypothetical protein
MPSSKTFTTSKDSSVVLRTSDSASFGAGKDYHLYVGSSGGYTLRSLVQFNLDFSDVTSITSATLYLTTARSNDGTVSGYVRDAHGTFASAAMHISRVTSAWTEGTYGNDETFNGSNSVEWSNQPSTTVEDRVSFTSRSSRPSTPTEDVIDITGIVTDWFNGATNYGIQIKYQTESTSRFTEWYSREGDASTISGAVGPYIVLEYETITNPTVDVISPTSGSVAKIVNLNDTTEWTNTSENAMPQFTWDYDTGGGGTQAKWRLRIYNDASKTTTYYDSGLVVDPSHAADQTFSPVKNDYKQAWIPGDGWSTIDGLVNGTAYYWTIQVYDEEDNASEESAPTAFKVRWGQAVYEFDTESTTSGSWNFTHAQPPANTQAVPLFRAVTSAGTTSGAWELDESVISGSKRYLQVLLRMSTDDGTQPYVDDISLSYSDSAVQPDNWEVVGGSVILSTTTRRFGTRSALATASTAGEMYLEPLRQTGDYDIPVTKQTRYTFSAYIRPGQINPRSVNIRVFKSDGLSSSISGLSEIYNIDGQLGSEIIEQELDPLVVSPAMVFPPDIEGWSRVTYTFDTDSSTDFVKPIIYMSSAATATPNSFYVDGVKFEEGGVASTWSPGSVTQSVVYEGSGISIDASNGGTIRLRGSSAGERNTVSLGSKGLVFGATSSPQLYSLQDTEISVDGWVRSYRTSTADLSFGAAVTGDTYSRGAMYADGKIEWGPGGETVRDTNLYRGGAGILKTDDSLWVAGNTLSSFARGGSADSTTITYPTEYYALTNAQVSFTPTFVGQRWLLTLTGYASLNTTTVQYAFVRGSVNNTAVAVSTAARSSTTATINTSTAHGMTSGDTFIIALTSGPTNFAQLNGLYTVATAPTTTSFTYVAPSSGTITSGAAVGSVFSEVENMGFSRADNYGSSGRGGTVALTRVYTATTAGVPLVFKFVGTAQTTSGLTLSLAYTQINAYPIG